MSPGLIDRAAERGVLDQFVAGVRAGEGQSLVVRGEPGVGKTALLDYLTSGRAQARGGLAAAAAFLERSFLLTVDPARRGERTVAAAQANLQAGAFDKALGLLVMAEAGPSDELQGARVDLLRGQIAFSSGLGSDAPPLLLKAAARLESLDLDLARETYLSALGAFAKLGITSRGQLHRVLHS